MDRPLRKSPHRRMAKGYAHPFSLVVVLCSRDPRQILGLISFPSAGLVETSFARSSGAGGQHVNRTMSKAIIRFPLPSAQFIPPYCVPRLRQSPHFAASPPSLLISASTHRTQHTNLTECLDKLKAVILDAARRDLVGDTTAEQKNRVKGLVAKEKAKMERVKKHRKDVKGGRGKVSF